MTVDKETKSVRFFQSYASQNYMLHFFLGREGSDAGKYFNSPTIELIRNILVDKIVQNKKPLISELTIAVYKYLKKYCRNPQKVEIKIQNELKEGGPNLQEKNILKQEHYDEDEKLWESLKFSSFEEKPIVSPICLVSGGDLSLLNKRIIYDGYHIMIAASHQDWEPQVN